MKTLNFRCSSIHSPKQNMQKYKHVQNLAIMQTDEYVMGQKLILLL